MAEGIQGLFEAVRSACSSAAWSRGVELVRAEAVQGESDDGEEIELRVATRGGLISPRVILYASDEDWECDCSSRESACEHVAAAVIEARRAREQKRDIGPAAATAAAGRVGYRFARRGGALILERVVVGKAGESPLRSTLSAIASGRVDGPRFVATQADLAVESLLGARRGEIPRGLLPRLLEALEDCADVTLDGRPIHTSAEAVGLRARVEEVEGGLRLAVGRDERVSEVFDVGVALCGDTLCPVGQASLTGREIEDLRRGRVFGWGEAAELATRILPSLEGRIPVDVRARLPETVEERPRLSLEVKRAGDTLSVLPTLVYGDPPVARIDADRLVALGPVVPVRDEPAERALRARLRRELGLQPGHRVELDGGEAVALAERLRAFRGEVRGDAHHEFFRAPTLVPRVEIGEAGFEVSFESGAPEGPRRADPARVFRAWRERRSLVPLEGGGFAPLPADWLTRFGPALTDLLAARAETGALPRCALPDLARLAEDLDQPAPPSLEGLRALARRDALPRAELPADLAATLRRYQREGVDWLCALRDAGLGALLADDMGLGKTLQALCAVRGRTLVVAPTSVLDNWAQEIRRFRPALSTCIYHGPKRALDEAADVTLTTYAVLRLDVARLAEVAWDSVVLDEAQAIKNPRSQVARAAYRLPGDFRLTLSGTPVENRLDELWSQLHFANRGLLGGRRDFEERYARPIERGDADATRRLRVRVRPFLLRRLKRDVAPELPPRSEVVLRPVLSEKERGVYDAVRAATRADVVQRLAAGGGVLAALEALLRLRQAACHSALVPGQSAASSSKLALLLELLDESVAEGHKALVFSQWTSLLDLVEPALTHAGIGFARLDGATRDRAGVVARFQAASGPPVLLASLKAGGVGLNLTAADHVFILDPWWNPAAEDQAADRAHRIGQERPVLVHRLVARDTVEERILALQGRKRELAEAALGGASAGPRVTRQDLLALLE